MKTRLTEVFSLSLPVIQALMACVAGGALWLQPYRGPVGLA